MKPLKYVLIALPLSIATMLGASFFLPSEIEVQKSVFLEQLPEEVYPYLINPMQWEHWSVLNKSNDPSMIHLYGGPVQGKGARLQWSGDRVGNGLLVFTESIHPSSIGYQQSGSGALPMISGTFTLTPHKAGSLLIWRQKAVVRQSPLAKLQGMLQKYKMQQEAEKGLQGLQTLVTGKKLKS